MTRPQQPDPDGAYTGETIVMPRVRPEQQRAQPPGGSQRPRRTSTPPRRAPRSIGKTIRRALLAVIGLVLLLVVLLYIQIASFASQVGVRDMRSAVFGSTNGMNLLIVGVDEREGHPEEGVRSDTLIVAHLDMFGRWTNMLSIPRDTVATIADAGENKINIAYGYGYANADALFPGATPHEGGMALAAQTVENLLGWPDRGQRIDYVTQVNFDGFASLIDALGGITINVPKYIYDPEYPTPDFGTMEVEFQPGVQKMDGQRALIYARTRHADSDFERGARQQQVIRAIMSEIRSRGPVGQALLLPRLSGSLKGTVATTMPFARPDLLGQLGWFASGVNPDEIGQVRLSDVDPDFQEVGSDLIWSQAGLKAAVDALLTRPSEVAESATIQVLNGTSIAGLAGRVSAELETVGFTVIPAGNADGVDAPKTIVYNLNNKPRTSKRLADLLKGSVQTGALPDGVTSEADIVVILGAEAANR